MKIMIRGTNWIGDAVMSIPALREFHRVFDDSRITLYTRPWAEGIFRDADFFDEILTYDKKKRSVQALKDEVELIRAEKFDLAVLLTNSFESALVTKLAGIPRRIGFNKDLRGLLLTDPIAVPEWKGRTHEVYYYLALVAEVERRVLGRNTPVGTPDASLDISRARRTQAIEFLVANGADPTKPIVALGVGSKNSRAKRWPADRYSELADQLVTKTGANIVLVGAPDEADVAASVRASARSPLIDITGKTDLASAAAILAVMDLFISNDMGLAHVAAAAGSDTLVIFGPTDDVTTRPFAANASVIRHHVECSPCMLRDCPIDHRCMTRIGVDEVFEAAVRRLSQQSETNTVNEKSSIY
jgi:heptosyltransferase-2